MFKNILKTSWRSLLKNLGHTVTNILGLTIGLSTVLLIFIWIAHHKSFDRFHTDSEQLYKVVAHYQDDNGEIQTDGGAVFEVMEEAGSTLPQVDKVTRYVTNWRWPSEQCFKLNTSDPCIYQLGMFVDSSFLDVFDYAKAGEIENPLKEPKSLVLTKSLAKKLFKDENPVGQIYKVGGYLEVTITAVIDDAPPNSSFQFDYLASLDVFHTLRLGNKVIDEWIKDKSYSTYLKLNTNDKEQVLAAINALETKKKYSSSKYDLQPMVDQHLYPDFKDGEAVAGLGVYIDMFGLFALFILAICIINFVNLSTSRATLRSKEIGVRKVTGASKTILFIQFMVESFWQVAVAALLAILITNQSLPMVEALIAESMVVSFTTENLLLLTGILVFTVICSGAYPALIMSGYNPIKALKSKGLKDSNGSLGLRKMLTIVQVVASAVIILISIVIYQQLDYMKNENLGYDKEGIILLEPTYSHIKGYDIFKNNLLSNHQIKAVGLADVNIVNTNNRSSRMEWPGMNEQNQFSFKKIGGDEGLVEALGLEILDGNNMDGSDSIHQIMISEEGVRLMGLENPVGQQIQLNGSEVVIAGIVNDFYTETLDKTRIPVVISEISARQAGTIYIKYDREDVVESLAVITAGYNELEEYNSMKYSFLDEQYDKRYKSISVTSIISISVMLISFLISMMGIVGLTTYNLIRRYKEAGIRKVFGANVMQIQILFLKDFLGIIVLANFIAIPVAYFLSNSWLDSFAYRIDLPVGSFALVTGVILTIVMIIVGSMSFGAATTNPAKVIQEE